MRQIMPVSDLVAISSTSHMGNLTLDADVDVLYTQCHESDQLTHMRHAESGLCIQSYAIYLRVCSLFVTHNHWKAYCIQP